MSKYTRNIQKAWKSIKKPYDGFTVSIVEYGNVLNVRVYEDEIMQFNDSQRVQIMNYLESVRKAIEMFGVKCHIEGLQGAAPKL